MGNQPSVLSGRSYTGSRSRIPHSPHSALEMRNCDWTTLFLLKDTCLVRYDGTPLFRVFWPPNAPTIKSPIPDAGLPKLRLRCGGTWSILLPGAREPFLSPPKSLLHIPTANVEEQWKPGIGCRNYRSKNSLQTLLFQVGRMWGIGKIAHWQLTEIELRKFYTRKCLERYRSVKKNHFHSQRRGKKWYGLGLVVLLHEVEGAPTEQGLQLGTPCGAMLQHTDVASANANSRSSMSLGLAILIATSWPWVNYSVRDNYTAAYGLVPELGIQCPSRTIYSLREFALSKWKHSSEQTVRHGLLFSPCLPKIMSHISSSLHHASSDRKKFILRGTCQH